MMFQASVSATPGCYLHPQPPCSFLQHTYIHFLWERVFLWAVFLWAGTDDPRKCNIPLLPCDILRLTLTLTTSRQTETLLHLRRLAAQSSAGEGALTT